MNSYSLLELQQFVKRIIALNFDQAVWLKAEIGQASQSRGHFYLNLVQKDEFSDQIIAETRAQIWKSTAAEIQKELGPQLPLADLIQTGNDIEIQVQANYHERFRFSLQILQVNAAFNLGQLAKQRTDTINQLVEEKLIDQNKQLPLPKVIQHIAVLSAEQAAGYADFKAQLKNNLHQYKFQLDFYPIAVQGKQVSGDVLERLQQIQNMLIRPDLIIILRGGGSKLDLMAFDAFDICKAVAQCPIPVLSAIGHETDESVLDLVANQHTKTPTAAADFLVERALIFESECLAVMQEIQRKIDAAIQVKTLTQNSLFEQIKYKAIQSIQTRNQALITLKHQIESAFQSKIIQRRIALQKLHIQLQLQDPEQSLNKGYAFLTKEDGQFIRSVQQTSTGDTIHIHLKDGQIHSTVTKIKKS